MHYGIQHTYGAYAVNDRGNHIGIAVAFATRAERDARVDAAMADHPHAGCREPLWTSDARDRRAIKNALPLEIVEDGLF